jgi:hypothetical protein
VGEGFAPGSSADLIAAADEGFNFAGQIQPLLSELAEHAVRTREQLLDLRRARS